MSDISGALAVIASVRDMALKGVALYKLAPFKLVDIIEIVDLVKEIGYDVPQITSNELAILPELKGLDAVTAGQLTTAVYQAYLDVQAALVAS